MSRLADKVALVFGATSGIGAAVAVRFAAEGATVIAAGLERETANPSLLAAGLQPLSCDIRSDSEIQALVHSTIASMGRIDVLVNAAGVIANDSAASIDDFEWSRMHDVNLHGSMRTMRAILPGMLSRRSGAIVNIASVAAFNAGPEVASYAASKAGLVALTRSAAHAYGSSGVRVNALCPGWVDTPMAEREMRDLAIELGVTVAQARERTVARIALARMARPEEMAAACLFLSSDESSFVTGIALVADGGSRVNGWSRPPLAH